MKEVLLLVSALAAIASLAWLPLPVTRVLGATGLAALFFLAGRPALGDGPACALAFALGALALRLLPPQILRRLAFGVPSFVLLIAVTTALMYLAPGNPFAEERARLAVILGQGGELQHFPCPQSSTTTGSSENFNGSYWVLNFCDASRMRMICGSFCVA